MGRSSVLIVVGILVSASFVLGCPSQQPPLTPEPWNGGGGDGPIAVAAAPDASSLRVLAERERERINALLDVAERRELREGGPPVLREMKEQARRLDKIETRLNEIDQGAVRATDRDEELELVSVELRRLHTTVTLLADTLQ
jgi:hypothetical protein